ncbi:MAG: efflux RND transporter periplasmic adaptor subunit [Myxococcota bacterium]
MDDRVRVGLKILAPIVLVGLGAAGMVYLTESREVPKPEPLEPQILEVEVQVIRLERAEPMMTLRGVVEAARQIQLAPRVQGTVSSIARDLAPGDTVRRGEVLVRLDARLMKKELEALHADVDRAEATLDIERGAGELADREFSAFTDTHGGTPGEVNELATRAPQRAAAEASLRAAMARHERAELDMTFHSVRAPFDALVGEVLVGRGQNVGPQFPLMTLTDVSSFRVRARVPTAELARLPQLTAKEDAPERRAHVVQRLGALEQRFGAIVRGLDGSVDPTSRTASLVVDVPDPLGLSAEPPPPQALLLGGLVDVELETSALEGVAELPERAVYEGAHVYLCDEADTLRKRAVSLVGRTPGAVLVGAGLADGMRVVRTRLIAPVEGTRLQCEAANE